MDEDVFPRSIRHCVTKWPDLQFGGLLSEIASSMCSLSSNFPIAQQFLYRLFCFGRARDADVTLILFIRPHFVTFICLYAHNGKDGGVPYM